MAPPPPGDPGLTATGQAHLRQLIDRYADRLKANGAIRSPAVERAFRTVPRHRLLETFFHRPVDAADFTAVHHDPARPRPEDLELIYSDTALGTRLDLTHGLKVLEVGAGTGYNAALLAELVGDQRLVITVDVAEDVVAQTRRLLAGAGYPGITVLCRDGFDGVAERAPFDRIVATVGCADVSPHWAAQLAEDGRLLVPLRHAGGHPLFLLRREDGGLRGRVARWSGFMDARGQLHADRLWSMGIAQPDDQGEIRERQPWPGFGAYQTDPGPDDPVDEQDFLFYISQPGRPPGVLGAWWGRPERRAERLGNRRPERHPLVEGRHPGRRPRPSPRRMAGHRPPHARRLPGGVRPHPRGPPTPAHGLGPGPPLLPRTPLARGALTWFPRASVEASRPTSSRPDWVTVEVLAEPPLVKFREAWRFRRPVAANGCMCARRWRRALRRSGLERLPATDQPVPGRSGDSGRRGAAGGRH
jgi:protein-L-isoaspartate(D-aspartate) O-methyltransferase